MGKPTESLTVICNFSNDEFHKDSFICILERVHMEANSKQSLANKHWKKMCKTMLAWFLKKKRVIYYLKTFWWKSFFFFNLNNFKLSISQA